VAAPHPPAKRPANPTTEVIFGPVVWRENIFREAKAVIAAGMRTRPNLRSIRTRRYAPNNQYIIIGWDTAATAAWFVATWMEQRNGEWANVIARPNA
jgi:hypothetical protein